MDTSIKAYESVENIYDTLDEQGFSEAIETITKGGDAAQIESLLNQWEEKLKSEDLSETYVRKRVIKKEEVSYLPLSLQYTVEKESKTFAQVEASDKDKVSFEVNGDVLTSITASDLQGKNILLSFQPASSADQAIYGRYSSIFDIPAYAVYMKPVLLVDNEVVAEGEEYLESTLGTRGSFTINLTSGGKNTSVTNDITTGSMYAVTLDSQSITAEELQSVYDEAAALKDSVTEENVYSEEYLGKMLALAGKLYFAQVDIADTIAADMYDVSVTRSLSECITGYEVKTSSLYGRITSLSEGSLYIDVDTDSHSVVSLNGEEDVPREYMFSTGIMGSLYESTVWEELTGYESVSTISILAKAQEEDIDILLISSANLDTELGKLNTDETTKQTVVNAVNSGKVVTIPAEEVTMGNWHGTGYIVTNPETGTGAYMISGGLNGGSTAFVIDFSYMLGMMLTTYLLTSAISGLTAGISALCYGIAFGMLASAIIGLLGLVLSIGLIIYACNLLVKWEVLYYDYLLTGNIDEGLYMSADIANEIIDVCKVTALWGAIMAAVRFAGIKWKINYEDSNFIKEFTKDLFTEASLKHLEQYEGFSRQHGGIKGAHTLESFNRFSKEVRPIKELSRTKISEGIYEITYQVAKLDNNKVIEGEWLENTYIKTVIDTDILPLTKVKEMVLEAFMGRSFYRTSGGQLYINGTSPNGVKFEGWIDLDTNKLKSFYPVSKFQYDY